MSKEVYSKINESIRKREKAVFCLIVETKGSTPRKMSSKMLVYEDGRVVGTIGGGELEYFVVQKAVENINSNEAKLFNFGLKADFEMACGGNVTVYMETIKIPEQLVIFGAGHIGKSLANLAINLDFEIIVVDERPNIFDNWSQKAGITFVNKNYIEAINEISFDKKTFVCCATHAHNYDKEIAEILISKELAYIGVIASKNKASKISNYLSQKENISIEQVNKIDMPMGIPIACETPEEIAISIIAKIIDERNKKL